MSFLEFDLLLDVCELGLGTSMHGIFSSTPSVSLLHTVSKPPDVPELASPSNPRPSFFFRAPSYTVALYPCKITALGLEPGREGGEGGGGDHLLVEVMEDPLEGPHLSVCITDVCPSREPSQASGHESLSPSIAHLGLPFAFLLAVLLWAPNSAHVSS